MTMECTLAEVRKIKRGGGLVGPEFFGCVNTGSRPTIYRSKLGGNWQWIVCREIDLAEAKMCNSFKHTAQRRVIDSLESKGQKLYFFRTSKSAFKKWKELVDKRKADNQAAADEVRRAQEALKANRFDIGAALTLGDHGVL
jgi:hypothetical protein